MAAHIIPAHFLEGVRAVWSDKRPAVSFLSCSDDVTLPSSAKLQLVTGWTPHMNGKGGEVHKGKEGEEGRVWLMDETNMRLNEKKVEF